VRVLVRRESVQPQPGHERDVPVLTIISMAGLFCAGTRSSSRRCSVLVYAAR